MSTYSYKGYKISNLGYHQPDHCVWWEAVDKNGCACFHGNTLREVEMLINDSEWEDKVKAKDAEIKSLRALVKELAVALEKVDNMCDGDMCKFFTSTKHCSKCKYLENCQTGIAHNALKDNEREIAKAREVIG